MRAAFTLPPPMCEWMSMPPAMTILPETSKISSIFAPGPGLAMMRPSRT
jgi:hypothetical protein